MPALAMVFVDQSVLPVALPTIQKYLEASTIQLEWCINSYLLLTAILVLAGGKVGDWIGHRKAFSLGMAIFALASALCGAASDVFWLIMARALQGIGAALMFPASTALLMALFPSSERGKAMGISVSASSLFLIIGPLVGGYLTQALSWRWIFWINLPIGVMGLILVYLFIPKSIPGKPRFDIPGFLFFLIGCTALVVFLMEGRLWGISSPKTIVCLALVLVGTILMLWREKRAAHPFLDLSLFKHPVYSAINISIFATQFILMITVFRTLFFQDVLGWSPMKTGVITVLSSFPILFLAPVGGILSDKFGPKVPITIGFFLLIFSFVWTPIFVQDSIYMLLIGLITFGCGIPLVFTPSYAAAMGAIPPTKIGSGFGTIATIRSLSATLGVAALGTMINQTQLFELKRIASENPLVKNVSKSIFSELVYNAQNLKESLANLTTQQFSALQKLFDEAQISSFLISHLALGGLTFLAFIFVFNLHSRKSGHHLPETPAEGWD